MHFLGYVIGITYYLALPWSIVIESNVYSELAHGTRAAADGSSNQFLSVSAILLFFISSIEQSRCHRMLADLRLDGKNVKTKQYFIPQGDLFRYVSSPHYLMEIFLYLGLTLLVPHNISMYLMLIFVCVTLISSALASHRFYNLTFGDYPSERKAIIPFLL
jgi:protein-S-isoprenylcysteine O-methyltransferase Ste14